MTNNSNNSENKIRLGNKDFILTREIRLIDDIKLDPENQRVSFKRQDGNISGKDKDLQELLWGFDYVKDLYQSIYQNGGLIEDPIINSKNVVVEGNCRTVALRELHKKYKNDERFSQLYVRVLPKDVTKEQVTLLLGELHIAGKSQWSAYEQAEYVWKMNREFKKPYDYLSSHLRWSRSKLIQKISAYEETKSYLGRTRDPQGVRRFSFFEEFMKRKSLREKKEDRNFMEMFGEWVWKNRIPEAVDVRVLPKILENEEAYRTFQTKGIIEAKAVLKRLDPSITSNLWSTVDQAIAELETISLNEIKALIEEDKPRLKKFNKLKSAISDIEEHIKRAQSLA